MLDLGTTLRACGAPRAPPFLCLAVGGRTPGTLQGYTSPVAPMPAAGESSPTGNAALPDTFGGYLGSGLPSQGYQRACLGL